MPVEIELKLRLDPRAIPRLRNHPILKRATQSVSRKLYSAYYDTPDLKLWRMGTSLRLRRSGGHWVQTIKSGDAVAAGLHQRGECEAAVATQFPDFNAITDAAIAAQFASLTLRARLKPVIITEFTRVSWRIAPAPGVAIEASIDRGVIKAGDASEPLCELELEVKAGPAWRAYETALQLVHATSLRIDDRSKVERGIAMLRQSPRKPLKTAPSPVIKSMTCNDAFKALAQSCITHLIANQQGMLDSDDPEYLHQMRVALRRLRSVFSTFAPLFPPAALDPPLSEIRWLASALGEARNWDVFATETLPPVHASYREHAGIAAVILAASRLRQNADRRARRAVASARGQGSALALGGWLSAETWRDALNDSQRSGLQQPLEGYARNVFAAASRRVLKRSRHIGTLAPDDLHRLRIAAKKLRYAADFFAPLYSPKRVAPYLARLADLQQVLGLINDVATATQLLAAVREGGAMRREALGIIMGWNALNRAHEIKRLARAWRGFKRAKTFW